MKNYIEKREKLMQKSIDLMKEVYPENKSLLNCIYRLTTTLKIAEPNIKFVNDLSAFIEHHEIIKTDKISILYTVFHDLEEFESNREKIWFCPRSYNYTDRLKKT